MEKNEISVVMSVYNTKIFLLNKTIKSILDQTYKNFEFLIVNDGSNKEIDHELKRWLKKDKRIKVMSNEINIGLTKSLNKALKCAKGRYVARIDAGDTCRNDRLKIQKDFLDKHKDFALIGSYMKMVNEGGDIIGQITYPVRFTKIKENIIRTNLFSHPTLMFRKDVIDELGGYNNNFYYSQDYELILRVLEKHKVANLPMFLIHYLFDTGGITASPQKRKKQDHFALKARYNSIKRSNFKLRSLVDYWTSLFEYVIPFRMKMFIINLSSLFHKKNKKVVKIRGKKIYFYN